MKYSLIIVIITLIFYFVFSAGLLYIPTPTLIEYGFSFSNLAGAVTYPFLHIGLSHLIGNMALLIAIGFIAEKKLKIKDFFAIYFSSAIVAGIVFSLLSENALLVGASAAVAGLLIPACLISFKKTAAALCIFTVFMSLLFLPMLTSFIQSQHSLLSNESISLQKNLNEVITQKNETQLQIQIVEQKFKNKTINETEYNETRKKLTEKIENLTEKENKTAEKLNETMQSVINLEEGQLREKTSRSSFIAHMIGSFSGLGYIVFFRRDILAESPKQVLAFERWLKKMRKKFRKKKKSIS